MKSHFKGIRNVCVFEGAPRGRVGAGVLKAFLFVGFPIPLENMEEMRDLGPSRDGFGGV